MPSCKTAVLSGNKFEDYFYGGTLYKPKKVYETHDEAIIAARVQNASKYTSYKLVAYRCEECNKYHIGHNGNVLSEKDRKKAFELLTPELKSWIENGDTAGGVREREKEISRLEDKIRQLSSEINSISQRIHRLRNDK
jgi:hypothetical protein